MVMLRRAVMSICLVTCSLIVNAASQHIFMTGDDLVMDDHGTVRSVRPQREFDVTQEVDAHCVQQKSP